MILIPTLLIVINPDPFYKLDQETAAPVDQGTDRYEDSASHDDTPHSPVLRRSLRDQKRPTYLDNYQCSSSIGNHWYGLVKYKRHFAFSTVLEQTIHSEPKSHIEALANPL